MGTVSTALWCWK